jgi:transposase InsO family protein
VEQQREEFARRAQETTNFSQLCREYEITRRTGYKWLERAGQEEPLDDRSRRPNTSPGKTRAEIEAAVVAVRKAHPAWGGKKIRKVLENQGVEGLPCIKTCNNILKRNGCISEEASQKSKPVQRFERKHCNSLWQTDFKGDFALTNGGRCWPLSILDDHSRFLLAAEPKPGTGDVIGSFRGVFMEYGVPRSVLSDNGTTFRGFHGGFAQFERWLMEHDVLPIHGRLRHPQTQGKVERLHGTMEVEVLAGKDFSDLMAVGEALAPWRQDYNFLRPHEALGMRCPGEVYVKSEHVYCDEVAAFEYSGEHHVIKVNSWGYVRFAHFQVYLSETFANQFLEFREIANPLGGSPSWIACFRNFRIAQFDTQTGHLINRSIRRL